MIYKVLLVDDDPDIIEFLKYNLEEEGFVVKYCYSGDEALQMAESFLPHVIVLDVMMGEMDGIETCLRLRANKELEFCAISFLSARSEDYTQISALDAGADDYMVKPIKPRLFQSRIRALIRRYESSGFGSNRANSEFGDLKIDKEQFVIVRNGNKMTLPKKEFELLEYLASKPGKVFTREEIFYNIWDGQTVVGNRTIDVHIRKLRKKLVTIKLKQSKGLVIN